MTSPSSRRSTARVVRGGIGGVLVVAVAAGYLLTSGALDPVVADVVARVTAPPASSSPRTAKVADWQYFDDTPEWSSQRGVPQVPGPAEGSPGDPVPPTRPAIAPPENPKRINFNAPPPVPMYSLAPMRDCPQPHQDGIYVANFEVTAIKGGATVTWWDLNDPDLVSYQLSAVPEYVVVGDGTRTVTQLPIKSVTIAAPKACKNMSGAVTGLQTGASYRIVLQAFNKSKVTGMTYRVNRGTTDRVVIG